MKTVTLTCLFALGASSQVVHNLRYNGLNSEITGTCSTSFEIYGQEPAPGRGGRGMHPVALYVPGTNEQYRGRAAMAYVSRMEALGFAAFTIDYPNRTNSGCMAISNKAACMFGSGANTAVAAIQAAVPTADMSRIVVAGISQGAQIAVISRNDNANVKAAWAIGVGNILVLGAQQLPMQLCMNAARHQLASMQIFAANAADDRFFDRPTVNAQLMAVTGNRDCSNFHNPNGSGCRVIAVNEFRAGSGHAYPFSDFVHWSSDPMIDWGLIRVSQWLCDMVTCRE